MPSAREGTTPRGVTYTAVSLDDPWTGGTGLPVVFQHGLGIDRHAWTPWLRALVARHPVVTADLRGHGGSMGAWRGDAVSLDDIADDLRSVLDACEIECCHLVGESFGGTAVLHLAATSRERVASATVCSTGWKGEWFHGIRGWERLLAEEGIGGWSRVLTAARFDPQRTDTRLLQWVDQLQQSVPPDVVWAVARCLLETDLSERLTMIEAPVLTLLASSPFVDSRNLDELVQRVPRAEGVRIPDARHGIALSHWAECVAACSAFLDRTDRALRPPG